MRSHLLKFAYEVIYDMKENINKIFAPNLICVCIDTVENGDYIGKFWQIRNQRLVILPLIR